MKLFNLILDFLYPKRCPVCHDIVDTLGQLICEKCRKKLTYIEEPWCMKCGKPLRNSTNEYCNDCIKNKRNYDEGRSVFLYDDVMRKSIYSFKYNGRTEYAEFYATEIYNRLKQKIYSWKSDALIPIPLHKSKLKKRGYNQAYLIAKELSKLTGIPVKANYLIRTKNTTVQKKLDAGGRAQNAKNAFKISQNEVKLQSAILIDDIYTTGATIMAATEALRAAGVEKVYYISLSIGHD